VGVRVAYGNRDAVTPAIQAGKIPPDSMIITKDQEDISELFFYDVDGNMKSISERSRFLSITEAVAWARKYDCRGHIYSIQNGSEWKLYVVQEDYSLKAVENTGGGDIDVESIERIDGGTPFGLY